MGLNPEVAAGYLRLSFGPETSEADVDAFLSEFARIADKARSSKAA